MKAKLPVTQAATGDRPHTRVPSPASAVALSLSTLAVVLQAFCVLATRSMDRSDAAPWSGETVFWWCWLAAEAAALAGIVMGAITRRDRRGKQALYLGIAMVLAGVVLAVWVSVLSMAASVV
jgi:hypothetical protein